MLKSKNVFEFLTVFLGFASKAAPVAAKIAKETGNDEVASDINKAGMAADALLTTTDTAENTKK